MRDTGNLKEDEIGSWDYDIDPSFPTKIPICKIFKDNFLGDPNVSLIEWLKNGPIPDVTNYIQQYEILGISGKWIMLDGSINQESKVSSHSIFSFVRTFFVSKNDVTDFISNFRAYPLSRYMYPEKTTVCGSFAGEIPWCDKLPKISSIDLEFVIGAKKIRKYREEKKFFLDGNEINISQLDLLLSKILGDSFDNNSGKRPLTREEMSRLVIRTQKVEYMEETDELRSFKVYMPVCNINLVGQNIESHPIHGVSLEKRFAKAANLVNIPQTFDLQTKEGYRASFGLTYNPGDYHNNEQTFFIHEDILRNILEKLGLTLIWMVYGERELSTEKMLLMQNSGQIDNKYKYIIQYQ